MYLINWFICQFIKFITKKIYLIQIQIIKLRRSACYLCLLANFTDENKKIACNSAKSFQKYAAFSRVM